MLGEIVSRLGYEREQAPVAAVAPRLAAFGDDNVGTRFDCLAQVSDTLHLTDQRHAERPDFRRMRLELSEREHHGGWPLGQYLVEQLRIPSHGPGDETTANPRFACCCELRLEPTGVAIAAANEAKSPRFGYGGSEPSARKHVHGRRKNRVLDSKLRGQPCLQSHRTLRTRGGLVGK